VRQVANRRPIGNRPLEVALASLLGGLAEPAEVFRYGVAIALRRGLASRAADAAVAAGLLHFAAKLHFHLLDVSQRGLYALAQQRIVIQGVRIELPEIADQVIDIASRVGVAAVLLLKLLQALQRAAVGVLDVLIADGSAAVAVSIAAVAAVVVTTAVVGAAGLLSALLPLLPLLSALLALLTTLLALLTLLTALLSGLADRRA
jgi:hypothetical protein